MSDITKLLKKLAGAEEPSEQELEDSTPYTDPVYVEKLASAVEFLLEDTPVTEKTAETKEASETAPTNKERLKALLTAKKGNSAEEEAVKEASPTDALRDKLMAKVAKKADPNQNLIDALVAKLQEQETDEVVDEPEVEKESQQQIEPEDSEDTAVETSSEEDGETKESSEKGLDLATLLDEAEEESSDEAEKSVSEGVKTAASQDSSLSTFLKASLFAKVGRTEV